MAAAGPARGQRWHTEEGCSANLNTGCLVGAVTDGVAIDESRRPGEGLLLRLCIYFSRRITDGCGAATWSVDCSVKQAAGPSIRDSFKQSRRLEKAERVMKVNARVKRGLCSEKAKSLRVRLAN
jgi:hypothetical protein